MKSAHPSDVHRGTLFHQWRETNNVLIPVELAHELHAVCQFELKFFQKVAVLV